MSIDSLLSTVTEPPLASRIMTYNNVGRLSEIIQNGTIVAVYTHNALGQRTRKVTAAGTTVYHYDLNGLLISETQADGTPIRDYLWDGMQPAVQIDNTNGQERVSYLHTDHLMTPRFATDQQGKVVWRWEGQAFGNSPATGTVTVNLRFPGQYYDDETGLHYNWFRYYEPETGRYVRSDPIGLDGGLNTFGYVGGNPNSIFDKSGLAGNSIVRPPPQFTLRENNANRLIFDGLKDALNNVKNIPWYESNDILQQEADRLNQEMGTQGGWAWVVICVQYSRFCGDEPNTCTGNESGKPKQEMSKLGSDAASKSCPCVRKELQRVKIESF